jgi:hypothetical protein
MAAETTTEQASETEAETRSGRATIYGDYVAPAISSPWTVSPWHIDAEDPDQPGLTLCGKTLTGYLSRMSLHVSLLECSTCMKMGGER